MTPDPDERDHRAGEYVLGTLIPSERAAMELERTVDPATEAAVRAWQRRLAPFDAAIPPVAPDPRVWAAIARALPRRDKPMPADNDNAVLRLSRQVRRWRNAAIGAGALAAGLALFVALGPLKELAKAPPADRFVAVVSRGGDLPALLVSVDIAAGTAQVRPVGAETPAGRSLELWYVGGGAAPRTLGVIGAAARRVALPADAGLPALSDGVFAVSVEPPGGSPTGKPTGPVIYSGKLIRD